MRMGRILHGRYGVDDKWTELDGSELDCSTKDAAVRPVPAAQMSAGVSPVPVQMWQG